MGCSSPFEFKLGACPGESGAAGTTPQEVRQSVIGAIAIIGGALLGPALGDLFSSGGEGATAAEDTVVAGSSELPGDVAKTFTGGVYSKVTAGVPTTLYRVSGGTAKELGAYWTRTLPGSSADAVKGLALYPAWGNTAESWVSIRVPAGTTFFEGTAGEQPFLTGSAVGVRSSSRHALIPAGITGGGSLP